jgi:hypothetical protein
LKLPLEHWLFEPRMASASVPLRVAAKHAMMVKYCMVKVEKVLKEKE